MLKESNRGVFKNSGMKITFWNLILESKIFKILQDKTKPYIETLLRCFKKAQQMKNFDNVCFLEDFRSWV
jgi:hypothetical protein